MKPTDDSPTNPGQQETGTHARQPMPTDDAGKLSVIYERVTRLAEIATETRKEYTEICHRFDDQKLATDRIIEQNDALESLNKKLFAVVEAIQTKLTRRVDRLEQHVAEVKVEHDRRLVQLEHEYKRMAALIDGIARRLDPDLAPDKPESS